MKDRKIKLEQDEESDDVNITIYHDSGIMFSDSFAEHHIYLTDEKMNRVVREWKEYQKDKILEESK